MFVFETLASIKFLNKKGFQETLQSQYVPSWIDFVNFSFNFFSLLCTMFSVLVDFFSAQNAAVNEMRLTGVYSKYFQDLDR